MLKFIIKASGETDFLMKYPEEFADFTLEQEKSFINETYNDPDRIMIACLVEGRFAGNCMISFRTGLKDCHQEKIYMKTFLAHFYTGYRYPIKSSSYGILTFIGFNWRL